MHTPSTGNTHGLEKYYFDSLYIQEHKIFTQNTKNTVSSLTCKNALVQQTANKLTAETVTNSTAEKKNIRTLKLKLTNLFKKIFLLFLQQEDDTMNPFKTIRSEIRQEGRGLIKSRRYSLAELYTTQA